MKIVEATLIIPVTCLIITALIGLMMSFYIELDSQISENLKKRDIIYKTREVSIIRLRDSLGEVLPYLLETDK